MYNRAREARLYRSPLLLVGCGPLVEVPEVIRVHVTTPGASCSPGDEAFGAADPGTAPAYVVNRVDDFLMVELEDEYVDAFEAPVVTTTTFVGSGSTSTTGTEAGYTSAYLGPGGQAALDVTASVGCKTFGSWPDGVYTRKVTVTAWEDDQPEDEEDHKVRIEVVVD